MVKYKQVVNECKKISLWFSPLSMKYKQYHLRLKINSVTMQKGSDFNFLGLTIDEHLSWKRQCTNRIARTLGIMCRLKNFLPTHVLRILYNSLILPHLQYSIFAWGFRMERLGKLQKGTVCIITSSKYNSHTDPLFRKLNLLKANDHFEVILQI